MLAALAFGIKDGVTHAGCGVREKTSVTSEGEYTDPGFPCQEEEGDDDV